MRNGGQGGQASAYLVSIPLRSGLSCMPLGSCQAEVRRRLKVANENYVLVNVKDIPVSMPGLTKVVAPVILIPSALVTGRGCIFYAEDWCPPTTALLLPPGRVLSIDVGKSLLGEEERWGVLARVLADNTWQAVSDTYRHPNRSPLRETAWIGSGIGIPLFRAWILECVPELPSAADKMSASSSATLQSTSWCSRLPSARAISSVQKAHGVNQRVAAVARETIYQVFPVVLLGLCGSLRDMVSGKLSPERLVRGIGDIINVKEGDIGTPVDTPLYRWRLSRGRRGNQGQAAVDRSPPSAV